MSQQRYSAQEVVDAIMQTNGNLANAARMLGCSRETIYNYAKKYATVEQSISEARKQLIDHVEDKLFEAVNQGNLTAIIFTLKAHPEAKARGWSESNQHEVTGKGGEPLEIVFRYTHADHSD